MNLSQAETNIILNILKRIADIKYVVNNADDLKIKSHNQLSIESSYLFSGFPSLALLFSEFNKVFPNENFNIVSHEYMKTTMEVVNNKGLKSISLATGLSGIAFALKSISDKNDNYKNLQFSLNSYIFKVSKKLSSDLNYLNPLTEYKYDLMFGICGIINYLLLLSHDSKVQHIIKNLLSLFTNLSKNNGIMGFSVDLSNSYLPQKNKNGRYINLGLSHGISAILILLIKSYNSGITINFQRETIDLIANFLINQTKYDSNNMLFCPANYSETATADYIRDAWCYGTAGVSYSLLLAGIFLDNKNMKNTAICMMKDSLERQKDVISPTFCHGLSGLYFLSKNFYFHTKQKYFKEKCNSIKKNILEHYDCNCSFGFRDIEPINRNLVKLNNINLLSGVSGILLTISDDIDNFDHSIWKRIFLIDV